MVFYAHTFGGWVVAGLVRIDCLVHHSRIFCELRSVHYCWGRIFFLSRIFVARAFWFLLVFCNFLGLRSKLFVYFMFNSRTRSINVNGSVVQRDYINEKPYVRTVVLNIRVAIFLKIVLRNRNILLAAND